MSNWDFPDFKKRTSPNEGPSTWIENGTWLASSFKGWATQQSLVQNNPDNNFKRKTSVFVDAKFLLVQTLFNQAETCFSMNLLKEGQVDSSYCLLLCSAAKKNPQTMKSLVFILTLAIVVGETLAVEGLDFGDSFQFAIETRRDFNENCQGTVELRSRNDLLELSPDNHPKIERR